MRKNVDLQDSDNPENLLMPRRLSLNTKTESVRVMTEKQFERTKGRIRKEVASGVGSSAKFSLALTSLGITITLIVTLTTVSLPEPRKSQYLIVLLVFIAATIGFFIATYIDFKKREDIGNDICNEMDVNVDWSNKEVDS